MPDLSKEAAEELCEEWKALGKPGPDSKGTRGRGRRGGGNGEGGPGGSLDDLLDSVLPLPLLVNPCILNPDLCKKYGRPPHR